MTDPLVTLCRHLGHTGVAQAHAGLMRWERKELQATFPQIPSVWSTWVSLCAALCQARRESLGVAEEQTHDEP